MISVVVPVRNDSERLRKCLLSLRRSSQVDHEVIVVDDASTDSTADIAQELGVRLIRLERRAGPGVARNHGVRDAKGEIVVFVDADVCVHEDTLAGFTRAFSETPPPDAVFGAYDLSPAEPNLISQYKNLAHHFVHGQGAGEAATFWAGCGAVRRDVFLSLGGFNPAYARPSIEDIEFGVRLRRSGRRILLRPAIQATHLKRWTLLGLLKSDFWDRAVPWTELILRDGRLPDTLNLTAAQRLSAILAWTAGGLLLVAAAFRPAALLLPILLFLFVWAGDTASDLVSSSRRLIMMAVAAGAAGALALVAMTLGSWLLALATPIAAIIALNWSFYTFFGKQRGLLFALFAVPLHLAYFACSGIGLLVGAARHFRRDKMSISDPTPASPLEFKLTDAGSYDDVADNFDLLTQRYSAPFAVRVTEWAEIKAGHRVLDVGTGTGLCALSAAVSAGAAGHVLGVDLSDNMLNLARSRASKQALSVDFRHMDAEALDLQDGSIDVVVSLFALLHFPAPELALAEMRRVLKPGGRLVLAAGSGPPLFSRFTLMRAAIALSSALRRTRELRAPQALDTLLDKTLPARGREETSLARHGHARPVRIDALVRSAGFRVRQTHWESLTTEIESPEEFWDLQRTFSSRARKRLAAATPSEAAAARARLLEDARLVQADGGRLIYSRAAFFVIADRPAEA